MSIARTFHKISLLIMLLSFIMDGFAGWQVCAPMPIEKKGAGAVYFNGYIYVVGGEAHGNSILGRVDVYDPESNIWNPFSVPDLNERRTEAIVQVFRNKIFVMGGRDENGILKSVEVYDPAQNTWSEAHELRKERYGAMASVIRDTLFVLGGAEEDGLTDDVEWYDPIEDRWREVEGELDSPRASAFYATNSDTLYIFGGFYFSPLKSIRLWTPQNEWSDEQTLNQGRGSGATVISGDSVFIMGGETTEGVTAEIEVFNLRTKQLSANSFDLPGKKGDHCAVTIGDSIYIMGGHGEISTHVLDSVYVYRKDIIDDIPTHRTLTPETAILHPNYPNPFNGSTTIRFEAFTSGRADLAIYDATGAEIYHFPAFDSPAGEQRVVWNGTNQSGKQVATGVYFVVLRTGNIVLNRKILYVK